MTSRGLCEKAEEKGTTTTAAVASQVGRDQEDERSEFNTDLLGVVERPRLFWVNLRQPLCISKSQNVTVS